MANEPDQLPVTPETPFSRKVGEQAARKLRAQKRTVQGVWFGLGMMGLVGWSVAVPTLGGCRSWPMDRQALSEWTFMDVGATRSGVMPWVCQRLALGSKRRDSDEGRARGTR